MEPRLRVQSPEHREDARIEQMAIRSFKDILAWQRAYELTIDVYESLRECRDYSFKDQIQSASISIMNNIAEGYAKRSDKSFKNFLFIAKGSAAEVESMLLIAPSLGYITNEKQEELVRKVDEVSMLITGFIRKLPS